jgi:uncharacterized iron-regulated membrane protein
MRIVVVLALVATASASPCGAVTPAGASSDTSALRAVIVVADQPLSAVLKQIDQRIPGRALDARRVERDGRNVYRVKWLGEDGKVRNVTVDAESGSILRVR